MSIMRAIIGEELIAQKYAEVAEEECQLKAMVEEAIDRALRNLYPHISPAEIKASHPDFIAAARLRITEQCAEKIAAKRRFLDTL